MNMRHLLAAAALSIPASLPAQVVFEATYSVQQRGKDIGTEHVVLQSSATGGGTSALRLEFEGKFPASQETLRGTLTRGNDGALDQLQLEVRRGAATETFRAAQRGNRIYVTLSSAQGTRGGKEMPGGPGVILLDEQLQALLLLVADLATTGGTRVTAVYPRTGQRANITARRVEGGPRGTVVELTGDLNGRMQLDANGHVDRMDLPQSGITVTRLPS
jgi:hypothetical protein